MALILLILQIVSAIPTIIKLIQEIMSLIHGLKGPEKKAAETQLGGILKRHLKSKDPSACHDDLMRFHEDLKGKYGV